MKQILVAIAATVTIASVLAGQDGMLGFSSANSYVSVPSALDLMPQGGLTVESWFYFNPAAPGGSNVPSILRKDPGAHPYILRTGSGGGGLMQWIVWTQSQSDTTLESPSPIPVLSWHHLAGTYDGATMRMYLDGVQIASTPKTGVLLVTTGPLLLGQGGSPSETWRGYLDEIRIWSVARTGSQIQSTMFQRIDGQPGLVAAWHFDGGYQDLTGAHHGTPIANPLIVASTSPVLSTYLVAPPLVPIGAPLGFQLSSSPAPVPYLLEISASGTMPGTQIPPPGSGVLPLNQPFLYATYGASLPGMFQNFTGLTSASGAAAATLNVPALPQLVGLVVSSAFVTLDGTQPYGIGKISNARHTTITDYAPSIQGIAPPTGPAAGGWAVTLTGSHFQPGAIVRFDGAAASNVVVTPPGTITCFTPPGALGPANVSVDNPDGNQTQLTNAFTYVPTLVLTATNPVIAAPGGTMTVLGAGFQSGLVATLGGVPAAASAVTGSSFVLTVPQGSLCSVPLVVTLPDGQSATLAGANPTPVITYVLGPPGIPSGGSTFFVLGSDFHPGTTVTIGGAPASIVSMSTTAIVATAPPGSSGPHPLLVQSLAGCGALSTYFYQ